jgi:ferredoxin
MPRDIRPFPGWPSGPSRWTTALGIDVQGFAEQQAHIDNANSACIQCGMCVQACPMGVLELVDRRAAGLGPSRLDAGNW